MMRIFPLEAKDIAKLMDDSSYFARRNRGKAIDRIPLPPPQYSAASFGNSKPSHSSSHNSTRRYEPAVVEPPTSSACDIHVLALEPLVSLVVISIELISC